MAKRKRPTVTIEFGYYLALSTLASAVEEFLFGDKQDGDWWADLEDELAVFQSALYNNEPDDLNLEDSALIEVTARFYALAQDFADEVEASVIAGLKDSDVKHALRAVSEWENPPS